MKRAFTNFLVDGVIAAAFLATAVSGVLFLLPKSWVVNLSGSTPTMLGIPTASWLTVHDWSGIVMMAGVLLHCALHWRWIASMTRRTFGLRAAPRAPARREPARRPVAPQAAGQTVLASSQREPDADAARFTRAGFLKGAALVCGGLVAGGAVTRALTSSAGSTAAAANAGTSATAATGTDKGSVTTQSTGGTQTAADGTTQTATTVARVTVDSNACVGCGRCLGVCPQSVFAESGGRATAADPAACVLCQRCLRVCPANAITLNA
jgi:NAD-dependent dihydropyrimidine dehydrogenase PreA subunit